MFNLVKNTTSVALNRFFNAINVASTVTQQAFSKARSKFSWLALRLLNEKVTKVVYDKRYKIWRGYRLLAIDGTKTQLPADKKLKKVFGTSSGSEAAVSAQGSTFVNVLNGFIVDALLEPMSNCERTLATRHFSFLKEFFPDSKDLVIFDRWYPSFELIRHCVSLGTTFVMRLRTKFNREIDDLPHGCHNFTLSQNGQGIRLRVIKFKLAEDVDETLLANLFDYGLGERHFKEIYSLRWGIEVKYDILKHGLEIENF
jgi:hypothetical protein